MIVVLVLSDENSPCQPVFGPFSGVARGRRDDARRVDGFDGVVCVCEHWVAVHARFCLRQDELVNSKLGASDQSRKGFDFLTRDVRAAKIWEVGNVNSSGTNFAQIALGSAQQGNALRLSYTTNWNQGVLYWFDTNNMADEGGKLRRVRQTDGDNRLIADYLTNNMFFRAENYLGAVQTNRTHKGVIKVKMEFAQYQYPLTRAGPGHFFEATDAAQLADVFSKIASQLGDLRVTK